MVCGNLPKKTLSHTCGVPAPFAKGAKGGASPCGRPPYFHSKGENNTMHTHITVKGARVNNLKNIDVSIPRDKLVVLTGLSGSGKSSLAFDTI